MSEKRNTRLEVYKLIEVNKTNKEIAQELNISIRTVERYRQEHIKATTDNDKKTTTTSDKKRQKEVAKAKIISGSTLEEAAAQSNTTIDICKKLSSKENLMQSQKEFLTSLRQEHIKEIIKNKKDRLHINSLLKESILQKAKKKKISKELQDTLKQNELTEQEILELSRLERLEKFELDKQIYKDKRLLTITEELANLSDDDIERILEIIEQSKRVDSDE